MLKTGISSRATAAFPSRVREERGLTKVQGQSSSLQACALICGEAKAMHSMQKKESEGVGPKPLGWWGHLLWYDGCAVQPVSRSSERETGPLSGMLMTGKV